MVTPPPHLGTPPYLQPLNKTQNLLLLFLKKRHVAPVLPSSQTPEDDDDDDDELEAVDVLTLGEMLGEDLDDSDDDWDDDDDDDDPSELDDNSEQSLAQEDSLEILPLSTATIPRTCYLVINRRAELIVKPLKEFGHLGQLLKCTQLSRLTSCT